MEKREPLAVGMDVNWYSHYGKQNEISENKALFFFMTYLPCDSAIPLLSIYLKKAKVLIQKDMYTLVHSS